MRLLLFGTSGCHLCEQAGEIIRECLSDRFEQWVETVEITEVEQWQTQFAVRIPVLYHPETQKELGWPFNQIQVEEFIIGLGHE
jgi:hypothetical protein